MIPFTWLQLGSTPVELATLGHKSKSEKDLEILLLRRQLVIFEYKQDRTLRLFRGEKLAWVVLGTKMKTETGRTINAMGEAIRMVKSSTLFDWRGQLVPRK